MSDTLKKDDLEIIQISAGMKDKILNNPESNLNKLDELKQPYLEIGATNY